MNQCIFIGRITKEIELKTTSNNKYVCSFDIALDDGWGEHKKTLYPTIVVWGKQAEFISKQPKGTKVAVVAKYDMRAWQDKDGNKRYNHEFIAMTIEVVEWAKREQGQEPLNHLPQTNSSYSNTAYTPTEMEYSDEDLPF